MSRSKHPYPRHVRVSAQLQREISLWLMEHLPAPWNTAVTVTRVVTRGDMRTAVCHVLVTEPHREVDALAQLRAAHFELQRYLGANLHMKRVPRIEYKYDKQYEHAANIEKILVDLGSDLSPESQADAAVADAVAEDE